MKLAILVRKDLGMRTGKIAGQVAHAAVMAYKNTPNRFKHSGFLYVDVWYMEGQKKIVLKVPDENALRYYAETAIAQGLSVHEVRDHGLTQIDPDTLTCISIGPDEDSKIDIVTKGLSLL